MGNIMCLEHKKLFFGKPRSINNKKSKYIDGLPTYFAVHNPKSDNKSDNKCNVTSTRANINLISNREL